MKVFLERKKLLLGNNSEVVEEIFSRGLLSRFIVEVYSRGLLSSFLVEVYCRAFHKSVNGLNNER
jgi:hypothetical protein